ncbi:VanZ like family protein [Flavobacterium hercynium]|uniref:VanZ-like domain-containing protein n=2 Tax=Flavobacterium hercynium TaxID=387094 RepID=A0A226H3S4_9FLAO|nr:hypothetical protein B0A66_14605 [Flavobacterium hercynium]SMP28299.1 VanZ like family protein [Flavobacterium hercynium]
MLALLLVISIVFYFSWIPDSSLRSETYLPNWLLQWSNRYYNLRTAVPFVAVGFLLEAYSDFRNSNRAEKHKKINFIQNISVAALIICIAEAGQFIVIRRSPTLIDVFFGIAGSIVGLIGYNLLKKIRNAKQT